VAASVIAVGRVAAGADGGGNAGSALTRAGAEVVAVGDLRVLAKVAGDVGEVPAAVAMGERTLRGEVIDPKCYIGAMKPGGGKTHKACAECFSIRPLLVLKQQQHYLRYVPILSFN